MVYFYIPTVITTAHWNNKLKPMILLALGAYLRVHVQTKSSQSHCDDLIQ